MSEQGKLGLRAVVRIEIIQMADMPRWFYDVWADFDNGDSEPLQEPRCDGDGIENVHWFYVRGLRSAVSAAEKRWGSGHRIEIARAGRATGDTLVLRRDH